MDSVDAPAYLDSLARWVRHHEVQLATVGRRAPASALSWTTLLTLGAVTTTAPPVVLRLDPHHLYVLLLKFDQLAIDGLGSLDVRIQGGPARPMSYAMLPGRARDSDSVSLRSTFSAVSSFSMGSGWWGTTPVVPDDTANVKYLYSAFTKLPALRLGPFTFASSPPTPRASLQKPVAGFLDCPPPDTAVPLYAFKNLQALVLEDLDPRAFMGWDVLCMNLRSLEVRRSGMEDLGELLCDAVVEDAARKLRGRGGVGEQRRRRQGLDTSTLDADDRLPLEEDVPVDSDPIASFYPALPRHAWRSLVHFSVASNSLTFIPSPPLAYLTSLTSLDLSSNLLIAIPAGLSSLISLRSLNLSDNMIETLTGVSRALGNVHVINLAKNRIDNLSGLDRLFALERIDLRENRLTESLEVGRLAVLPHLKEVWLASNPFARPVVEGGEEHYRVKCFNYFAKEGRTDVLLDGSGPGMNERRGVVKQERRGPMGGRTASSSFTGAALGRVGATGSLGRSEEARAASSAKMVGRRVVTTPHPTRPAEHSVPPSLPSSDQQPPTASTSNAVDHPDLAVKHKRRKPKRIVDLDHPHSGPSSLAAGSHGTLSDEDRALCPVFESGISAREVVSSSSEEQRARGSSGKAGAAPGRRSQLLSGGSNGGAAPVRSGLTRTTFDPPTALPPSVVEGSTGTDESSLAFRRKIEALRNEVGESWLAVLGEREAEAERTKSLVQSRSEGSTDERVVEREAVVKVQKMKRRNGKK